jgi:hypothetical protein
VLPVVAKTMSSNADAYDYLNESIRDWPDQRTLAAWIREAGWKDVAHRNLSMGMNLTNMAKMLRCAGNDDIITIKADDGSDTVTFMFESPSKPNPRSVSSPPSRCAPDLKRDGD